MKHTIYRKILLNREAGKKMFAVLIDPEKSSGRNFASLVAALKVASPDCIFIGGNHQLRSIESMIEILKEEIPSDIILFPDNASNYCVNADALLYLSMISGRNPDYLIGQHVQSSKALVESDMEIIPTAYLLIDGGKPGTEEYISNTRALPRDHNELVLSTVLAGELLGMRLTYLEAGRGADLPVPSSLISYLKERTHSPLIVGGGIDTLNDLSLAYHAGADLVVAGTVFENNPDKIIEFVNMVHQLNEQKDAELSVVSFE